jgi:Protein of unknown function (DUF3455)
MNNIMSVLQVNRDAVYSQRNVRVTRQIRKYRASTLIRTIRSWIIPIGALMLATWLGAAMTPGEKPRTPLEITPPPGNILFLKAQATGTQNYICEPSANDKSSIWAFFSPQATLFEPQPASQSEQILTHFLSPIPDANATPKVGCTVSDGVREVNCPTWQSSADSSAVWGERVSSINAGTDASCPSTGSIPCLLLKAVAIRKGPASSSLLARTTFIQRLHTVGGAAPTASCKVSDHALVPYSATYYFYAAARNKRRTQPISANTAARK